MGDQKGLDEALNSLHSAFQNQGIQKQREELNAITSKYMDFIKKVSQVNNVLNTLQSHIVKYNDKLDILRMEEDHVYDPHIKRFERSLVQMNHDLNYFQSATSNIRNDLDLLRGMHSVTTQGKGIASQAALETLEGILIFYYSLNIWHLVIEEKKWEMIPSWEKLLIGFSLAVSAPLCTHFYWHRKWWRFGISLAIFVITIIFAFIVTF